MSGAQADITVFQCKTAWLILSVGLALGCASREAKPATQASSATNAVAFGTEANQAKLRACFEAALPDHPGLAVHTAATFFERDGKVVFVDVDLPDGPALASCLRAAILAWDFIPRPAVPHVPGAVSGGAFRIDWGPPPAKPAPRPSLAESRARHQRMVLEALQQGALREDDAIVREMRNPPPPWPTAEMRAQLDGCYRDALGAHPGLVLHRDVMYLVRESKVLLADVSIPEAPELARCIQDRVATWSVPFAVANTTVLSSFLLDLGAPEEFPDSPGDIRTQLSRRDALVKRGLDLGLMKSDDPLIGHLKPVQSEPPH